MWAFLAMAHHRRGDRAEARRWLDKLRAWKPQESSAGPWVRAEIEALRREAEAVVRGGESIPP
jgi:hypothetical protein